MNTSETTKRISKYLPSKGFQQTRSRFWWKRGQTNIWIVWGDFNRWDDPLPTVTRDASIARRADLRWLSHWQISLCERSSQLWRRFRKGPECAKCAACMGRLYCGPPPIIWGLTGILWRQIGEMRPEPRNGGRCVAGYDRLPLPGSEMICHGRQPDEDARRGGSLSFSSRSDRATGQYGETRVDRFKSVHRPVDG